jgi:hypothetical protein
MMQRQQNVEYHWLLLMLGMLFYVQGASRAALLLSIAWVGCALNNAILAFSSFCMCILSTGQQFTGGFYKLLMAEVAHG